MTIDNIGLFQAIGSKMDFLNQRQRVIAQNIANTDTPGYQPQDLVDVDFSGVLKDVINNRGTSVRLETTNPGHMPVGGSIREPRTDEQDATYEVAPAGNAVIMEEQLLNASRNMMDYDLVTNVLRRNVGMIQTAIGRQG